MFMYYSKKILLLVISFILYYFIHIKFISFILPQVGVNGTLIYFIIIIIGTIIVYETLNVLLNYIKNRKIILTEKQKKVYATSYFIFIIIFLLCRTQILLPYEDLINLNPLTLFSLTESNYFIIIYFYNIIVFLPIGFFSKIKFKKFLLYIMVLEVLQLILKVGFFDVNDIILYIIGFWLGRLLALKGREV